MIASNLVYACAQAGLLVGHVLDGRPDSQFSIGANQGYLSHGYRRNLDDLGSAHKKPFIRE